MRSGLVPQAWENLQSTERWINASLVWGSFMRFIYNNKVIEYRYHLFLNWIWTRTKWTWQRDRGQERRAKQWDIEFKMTCFVLCNKKKRQEKNSTCFDPVSSGQPCFEHTCLFLARRFLYLADLHTSHSQVNLQLQFTYRHLLRLHSHSSDLDEIMMTKIKSCWFA